MASKFMRNNLWLFKFAISAFLHTQKYVTRMLEINNNQITPCIYAMWHSDQFCVWGVQEKSILNILISKSVDGEIVAAAAHSMGFKTVRGSAGKKGAIESTLQMIELLGKGENVAMMVDGPHGPLHKVKNGVVKVAQKSGVPIVPVCWYSPQKTFIKFPSWDGMTTPVGPCDILNLYGDPIYVPADATDEQLEEYRQKVENSLLDIWNRRAEEYEKAKKQRLWDKK